MNNESTTKEEALKKVLNRYGNNKKNTDKEQKIHLESWEVLVALIIPAIGILIALTKLINHEKRSGKFLILISIAFSFISFIIFYITMNKCSDCFWQPIWLQVMELSRSVANR